MFIHNFIKTKIILQLYDVASTTSTGCYLILVLEAFGREGKKRRRLADNSTKYFRAEKRCVPEHPPDQ
jgi:hypothetical protein